MLNLRQVLLRKPLLLSLHFAETTQVPFVLPGIFLHLISTSLFTLHMSMWLS
jgi:hypothetical protein